MKNTIIDEIYRIGEIYRSSENDKARDCYSQYINLLILEADNFEQNKLEEMWQWEIE